MTDSPQYSLHDDVMGYATDLTLYGFNDDGYNVAARQIVGLVRQYDWDKAYGLLEMFTTCRNSAVSDQARRCRGEIQKAGVLSLVSSTRV